MLLTAERAVKRGPPFVDVRRGTVAATRMKDQTWGAIAFWVATILRWAFWVAGVMVVLQLALFAMGGGPLWLLWQN
jgi:hypothetical protein